MRMISSFGVAAIGCFAACSVPDKHGAASDAGSDGSAATPGDGSGGSEPPPPDGEAPDTTLDQAPGEFSSAGQATFRFSSNDPTATFQCRIDDEASQPCTSPYVRTLPDGPHSFSVRAVDAAGNSDDSPAEKLWTIDTVPPDTMLLDAPPAADNSVMAMFTFRSNEVNVVFDCSLDNAGYVPCTSGASFGPVGDGAHSFAVRAHDRAGNIDPTPAIYAWSVNTSTPDTQILTAPAAVTAQTTATFTFLSPDAGGGATFQCALDGAAFTACTSPVSYPRLIEGAHTFAVRVRDAVGNLDPSPADRSWTVDLTPPTTTIVDAPSGATPAASASISFTASETDVTFACSLDGAPATVCTSPAALTGLAQGAHTFAVTATDAAGHSDATPASVGWTVDTVAPNVMVNSPVAASTVGPRVAVDFTATEGAIACSFDGAPFAACASPTATNLPSGAHQVAVRATDAAGNVTTVTRGFTVACNPPDPAGAAGLLHLDTGDQVQPNAVAGGADATLGDTAAPETGEPVALAAGRFGGALAFTAMDGDHVAWPIALAAMPDLTIELWARPTAVAGARDIATSGDGGVALRVTAASPTTVVFSISIGGATVSSAPVAANAWHDVLASLHQPSLRLWVDGVRTEVDTVQLAAPPALDAVQLGGTGAAAFDGALDEVWIAQTAITADEPALARYCPL